MDGENRIIAYGRTAEIFSCGDGNVFKLFKAGLPLGLVEDEFRISSIVYNLGVSTPRPVRITDMNGRTGIIYQEVSGLTMLKQISKKPWEIMKEATRMAKIHSTIHSKTANDMPSQVESKNNRSTDIDFG